MNAQSNPPRLSALLGQVATVVSLSSSSLGLNRLDKEASKQADQDHNARSGTGKVIVSRLSGAEHLVKAIQSKANDIKAKLHGMTTAYQGQRLLANTNMQVWLGIWGTEKPQYDQMVEDFKRDAPSLIAAAEMNKGNYNVHAPSLDEINKAFALDFDMSQIPDSASYIGAGLDAAMNAEMQRRFETAIEGAYFDAQRDALKRVAEPVGHLIDRLNTFNEAEKAGGKAARLYETTITNVQDIGKVFASFNLTNDPLMTSVADKLKEFEGYEIDDLKANADIRDHLTKKAEEIMADLKDLI